MAKDKYTPSKNNPNFLEDTSRQEQALNFTMQIARDKSYHGESVVIKPILQPIFSNIALVVGADVHSGAVGSNAVREEKTIKFIRNTCNSIYVPAGDMFNSIIKEGEDRHEDKFGNLRAIEREAYLLASIANKVPVIIDGNHDGANGKRWMPINMSPSKHLADKLGIEHVEFGVLLQIQMPSGDYRREQRILNVYVSHCSGKTSGSAKSVDITFNKAMAELKAKGIVPDVIFGGHFHSNANGVFVTDVMQYNKSGKCIGVKRKDTIVVSESTLQETSRYAQSGGFPPSDSNVYINNLKIVKNPYYNSTTKDTQFEWIVEMTRFPMFRQGSDEYTDEAKEYMKMFAEPTHLEEQIKQEYSSKSIGQAIEGLHQTVSDFKSARFLFENEPQQVATQTVENVTPVATTETPDDTSGNDGM